MNHQIRRISALMTFGLLALLLNVGYTQIFNADSLRLRQDNTRLLLEEYGRQRGTVLAGNLVVAQSLVYGATGIERLYSAILSGSDDRLAVDRLQQLLAGKEQRGGVVQLTIDPDLQKTAYSALNGRTGAAVVMILRQVKFWPWCLHLHLIQTICQITLLTKYVMHMKHCSQTQINLWITGH